MSAELLEQLEAYGAFVEREVGVALSPTDTIDLRLVTDQPAAKSRRRVRRLVLTLAAAVVTVLGVLGAATMLRSGPSASTDSVPDPPTWLLLLPSDATNQLANGYLSSSGTSTMQRFTDSASIGRADGAGFTDLVTATVGNAPSIYSDQWVEQQTADGRAVAVLDDQQAGTFVKELRGSSWLTITGQTDNADLVGVLDEIVISESGLIDVSPASDLTVLEHGTPDLGSSHYVSYYEVTTAGVGDALIVETATGTSAIVGAGGIADRVTPTEVQGAPGWVITRDDGDESEWVGITWQTSPNRFASVSGHAPEQQVRALAEDLEPVDMATWTDALPGFTSD